MEENRERLRLDIIKAKRKLYLSYPPDSMERKNFILLPKKQELEQAKLLDLAPVKDEYLNAVKDSVKVEAGYISACFAPSLICLAVILLQPPLWAIILSSIGIGLSLGFTAYHATHLIDILKERKRILTIFKEKEDYINNLSKDVEKLSGNGHEPTN